MKILFRKNDEGEISVFIVKENNCEEFTYNKMILELYEDNSIEDIGHEGDFSDVELKSIEELSKELKASIKSIAEKRAEVEEREIATENEDLF